MCAAAQHASVTHYCRKTCRLRDRQRDIQPDDDGLASGVPAACTRAQAALRRDRRRLFRAIGSWDERKKVARADLERDARGSQKNSGRTYRSAAARRQRSQRPGAYCHESPRRTHAPDRQRHPWFADTHEPGIHSKSWPFQCQRPSTHTYCMPRRARGRGGRGGVLIGGGRRGLRSTAPGGGWLPGRGGGGRSSRANTRRGDTVHAAAMRVNARSTFRRVIHIAPVSC